MTEGDETINRKELARKMAISRTKVNNRRTLTSQKESDNKPISRKNNMICITGEEAGGY